MKKLLFLFVTIFTLSSCENDFDLTEDWKDITIVYGLLDQSQPIQYIRIEKAFLDPTTSALVLAQEADSLYYDNIEVQLVEFQSGNSSGNIFQLERVNAADEGFVRAEGIFASDPNLLYKFDGEIKEDFTYRLEIIKDGDRDNKIEAETRICQDFRLTSPSSSNIINTIRFRPNAETAFRWSPPSNSEIFILKLLINYTEAPTSDPSNVTSKQLIWVIDDKITPDPGDLARVSAQGTDFFRFIDNSLEPGFIRSLDSLDVEIVSGAVDLLNYLDAGQINGGITSSDLTTTYTNLNEGLGVFSSRHYKRVTGFELEPLSLDSLQDGYLTRDLGF
jgi:hypothetical protein